jgi:hypothetical protein
MAALRGDISFRYLKQFFLVVVEMRSCLLGDDELHCIVGEIIY